jgi:hypothetical protein
MNKFALLLGMLISALCSSAQHTHYYTQSVGNIYTLSTWGSSPDGSGPSPSSFSMNNAIFHFRNRPSFNLFAAGNFIVSGINSGIVIGNGVSPTTLTVPIGYTLSADSIFIDSASQLTNSGTVNWNKSHFSYYSTVVYNDTNTFQLVRGGEYGRLNLLGGSTTRFWPDTRTKRLTGNVVVANRLFLSSLVYCDSFAVTLGLSSVQPGTLTYDLITPYGGIVGTFKRWMPMGAISASQGFFPLASQHKKFQWVSIGTPVVPMFGGLVSIEYRGYWPATFGLPIYDSTGILPFQLNQVEIGHFKVVTENGFNGGSYNISVDPFDMGFIVYPYALRLLKRLDSLSRWRLDSGSFSPGGISLSKNCGILNMPILDGEYVIANDSTINVLPVTITKLWGVLDENIVRVNWETASESNVDYYLISDAQTHDIYATVKSKGNTLSKQIYHANFNHPNAGKELLLLFEAFDIDGTKSYSKIIKIGSDEFAPEIKVTPNPFTNKIWFEPILEELIQYTVYNEFGQVVLDGEISKDVNFIITENLPIGLYHLKVSAAHKSQYFKVLKVN